MTKPLDEVRTRARATAQALNQWPLLAVLAVVAVGLGLVAADQWRWGAVTIGVGMAVAAVLRLVLPRRVAGLLDVRGRVADVTLLSVMAAGIIFLAFVR